MANKNKHRALSVITKIWSEANDKSIVAQPYQSQLMQSEFSRKSTNNTIRMIPQDVVQILPEIFVNTSAAEKSLIIQIISSLKRNNVLWFFDYRSPGVKGTAKERAILSLRKKEILLKTEINALHIVNPLKLRRGSIQNVIGASNELIKNSTGISKKDYKHLKPPSKSRKDLFTDSIQ